MRVRRGFTGSTSEGFLGRGQVIAERDVAEEVAGWRILGTLALVSLGFPLAATRALALLSPLAGQTGLEIDLARTYPVLILVVPFVPSSFALVFGLESLVREKALRTLEWLLTSPVTLRELYLGKYLAALVPPVAFSYLSLVVTLWLAIGDGVVPDTATVSKVVGLITGHNLLMVAVALFVSIHAPSTRAANLTAGLILAPVAILVQIEALLLHGGREETLWLVLIGLLAATLIFVRGGLSSLSVAGLLGAREEPEKDGGWPRFPALPLADRGAWREWGRRLAAPFALAWAVALTGGAAGYVLGLQSGLGVAPPLDPSAVSFGSLSQILAVNLRVTALQLLLAVPSLGVAALAGPLVAFGLIGGLAGALAGAGHSPLLYLAAWVLPHGWVELPALCLGAALGLRLLYATLFPPAGQPLRASLELGLRDAVMGLPVLLVLYLIGALMETQLTPRLVSLVYG